MLENTSKIASELKLKYMKSNLYSIYDCYERPSKNKMEIYQNCLEIMHDMKGRNKKIPTYNKYYFTFAFETDDSLVYITKCHNYIIRKEKDICHMQ